MCSIQLKNCLKKYQTGSGEAKELDVLRKCLSSDHESNHYLVFRQKQSLAMAPPSQYWDSKIMTLKGKEKNFLDKVCNNQKKSYFYNRKIDYFSLTHFLITYYNADFTYFGLPTLMEPVFLVWFNSP